MADIRQPRLTKRKIEDRTRSACNEARTCFESAKASYLKHYSQQYYDGAVLPILDGGIAEIRSLVAQLPDRGLTTKEEVESLSRTVKNIITEVKRAVQTLASESRGGGSGKMSGGPEGLIRTGLSRIHASITTCLNEWQSRLPKEGAVFDQGTAGNDDEADDDEADDDEADDVDGRTPEDGDGNADLYTMITAANDVTEVADFVESQLSALVYDHCIRKFLDFLSERGLIDDDEIINEHDFSIYVKILEELRDLVVAVKAAVLEGYEGEEGDERICPYEKIRELILEGIIRVSETIGAITAGTSELRGVKESGCAFLGKLAEVFETISPKTFLDYSTKSGGAFSVTSISSHLLPKTTRQVAQREAGETIQALGELKSLTPEAKRALRKGWRAVRKDSEDLLSEVQRVGLASMLNRNFHGGLGLRTEVDVEALLFELAIEDEEIAKLKRGEAEELAKQNEKIVKAFINKYVKAVYLKLLQLATEDATEPDTDDNTYMTEDSFERILQFGLDLQARIVEYFDREKEALQTREGLELAFGEDFPRMEASLEDVIDYVFEDTFGEDDEQAGDNSFLYPKITPNLIEVAEEADEVIDFRALGYKTLLGERASSDFEAPLFQREKDHFESLVEMLELNGDLEIDSLFLRLREDGQILEWVNNVNKELHGGYPTRKESDPAVIEFCKQALAKRLLSEGKGGLSVGPEVMEVIDSELEQRRIDVVAWIEENCTSTKNTALTVIAKNLVEILRGAKNVMAPQAILHFVEVAEGVRDSIERKKGFDQSLVVKMLLGPAIKEFKDQDVELQRASHALQLISEKISQLEIRLQELVTLRDEIEKCKSQVAEKRTALAAALERIDDFSSKITLLNEQIGRVYMEAGAEDPDEGRLNELAGDKQNYIASRELQLDSERTLVGEIDNLEAIIDRESNKLLDISTIQTQLEALMTRKRDLLIGIEDLTKRSITDLK